ncbi:hypothetical protein FRC12_001772, partial [Ceratobasidium sp. 428]
MLGEKFLFQDYWGICYEDERWVWVFGVGRVVRVDSFWIGYSHADRIGGDMKLLEPKRIQETICNGKDIFNMLPE